MATIRLKKRSASGAAGAPSSLAPSEVAFNEADKKLYYGFGDNGSGESSSVISIAGEGAVMHLGAINQTAAGNKTFSGNLTVGGNLTVNGTTSTLNSTNSVVADKIIELGNGTSGSPSGDSGIVIERGSSSNAFMGWDESSDQFLMGTGSFTGASTGNLTVTKGTLNANLVGDVTGTVTGNVTGSSGSTTGNAATATKLATARAIGGQSFDGTADITIDYGNIQNTPTIPSNNNQLTNGAGYITSSGTAALSQGLTGTPSIVVGVSTATKSHVGVDTGAYGEELVVTGDARVTGILTIGTGSITLDPTAKQLRGLEEIVIGIANTITIKQDDRGEIEFTDAVGTPKSVGIGTTVSVNTSGIITATTFVGALTGNVTGDASGNAGTATKLATARNIGGVSFDGTGNIDLPGVNSAGNQNTSGTAAGLSATLAVGSGGTGATSLTANGVLIGNGTSAVTAVNMSTKGHLLVGDGSGNPQTLSVGSDDQVLTADSSTATGLAFKAAGTGGVSKATSLGLTLTFGMY